MRSASALEKTSSFIVYAKNPKTTTSCGTCLLNNSSSKACIFVTEFIQSNFVWEKKL